MTKQLDAWLADSPPLPKLAGVRTDWAGQPSADDSGTKKAHEKRRENKR